MPDTELSHFPTNVAQAITLAHWDRDGYPLNPLQEPPPDLVESIEILLDSLTCRGHVWLTGEQAVVTLREALNASLVKQFDKPMKFLCNLTEREVGRGFESRFGRALGPVQPMRHFEVKRMRAEGWQGLYADDLTLLGFSELFDRAKENFHAGRQEWLRMAVEQADEQLNCVPPRLHRGDAFAVGECYTSNEADEDVYLCVRGFTWDSPFAEAQYLTIPQFKTQLHRTS